LFQHSAASKAVGNTHFLRRPTSPGGGPPGKSDQVVILASPALDSRALPGLEWPVRRPTGVRRSDQPPRCVPQIGDSGVPSGANAVGRTRREVPIDPARKKKGPGRPPPHCLRVLDPEGPPPTRPGLAEVLPALYLPADSPGPHCSRNHRVECAGPARNSSGWRTAAHAHADERSENAGEPVSTVAAGNSGIERSVANRTPDPYHRPGKIVAVRSSTGSTTTGFGGPPGAELRTKDAPAGPCLGHKDGRIGRRDKDAFCAIRNRGTRNEHDRVATDETPGQ